MRVELGYKFVNIEKKTNGYFIGYNSAEDPRIRNMETDDTDFYDIRTSSGARRVRLTKLMEKYKGEINVKIGQKILADHYDVYLKKINPSNRTCCSHYDLDDSLVSSYIPFYPGGALDGIVTDTTMAREMSLAGRWGNSCGKAFNVKKFVEKNPQWMDQADYLVDRPSQKWTVFRQDERMRVKLAANERSEPITNERSEQPFRSIQVASVRSEQPLSSVRSAPITSARSVQPLASKKRVAGRKTIAKSKSTIKKSLRKTIKKNM